MGGFRRVVPMKEEVVPVEEAARSTTLQRTSSFRMRACFTPWSSKPAPSAT
jgi:hypothetical protein